jgi:hypothetical protein
MVSFLETCEIGQPQILPRWHFFDGLSDLADRSIVVEPVTPTSTRVVKRRIKLMLIQVDQWGQPMATSYSENAILSDRNGLNARLTHAPGPFAGVDILRILAVTSLTGMGDCT